MSEQERTATTLNAADSHELAMSAGIDEVVTRLVDILGLSLVAAIAGVKETRAVQQWTTRREPQHPQRLRFALQIALMISAVAEDGTVPRAWFQGSNPHLADQSPALMLRTLPLDEIQGPVMNAARLFASR